jgi:hypothetical protein|tara:strand:- start:19329 stop:19442 length:114 start_codon:yes stop_codon:yes gene_type:complete
MFKPIVCLKSLGEFDDFGKALYEFLKKAKEKVDKGMT